MSSKSRLWSKYQTVLKVFPAVLLIGVLFGGGMIVGILQSIGLVFSSEDEHFTLQAYRQLLDSYDFWSSLIYSLRIVLLSTFFSSIVGFSFVILVYVFSLQSKSKWVALWKNIWQFPFLIPHLVTGYMIAFLLMQSGWLARIGYAWGWIDEPSQFPILVQDEFGWGIIFAYTWKEAPFVVILLLPILYRIHREWFEVSRMFGASLIRYISTIVFPVLLPALSIAAFLIFAFTLSAYELPYVLGVTYPKFISVYGFTYYQSILEVDRQMAIAVYLFLTMLTCASGIVLYLFHRKWLKMYWRSW